MTERPEVSVVIVNWNVGEFVRTCLNSVLAEAGAVRLQVILVDNDSHDGSPDIVRTEFPQVELIANDSNLGFAVACNQGIAAARGEFVLMLNPDTEVLDGAIAKTVAMMRENPSWGVLGCQVIIAKDGPIQRTGFSFPGPTNLFLIATMLHRLMPKSQFFGKPELSFWDRQSQREVDVVTGMYMLVRQTAIEEVGPMDGDYFVYGEEADWCYRFWQAGWPCVFTPSAQIVHADGGKQSTSQTPVKMFVQLQKSLLIFNRKNLGMGAAIVARLIFLSSMSIRGPIWLISTAWRGKRGLQRAKCAWASIVFLLTGREPSKG